MEDHLEKGLFSRDFLFHGQVVGLRKIFKFHPSSGHIHNNPSLFHQDRAIEFEVIALCCWGLKFTLVTEHVVFLNFFLRVLNK